MEKYCRDGKIFAIITLIALVLPLLSGCTPVETGFIDMLCERNSVAQYRIEGVYGESGADENNVVDENYNTDVRYTAEVNNDEGFKHITLSGVLEGVEFSEPFDYYVCGNKYYVNKNIFRYYNEHALKNMDSPSFRYYNDISYLLDELDATVLNGIDYIICDSKYDYNMNMNMLMLMRRYVFGYNSAFDIDSVIKEVAEDVKNDIGIDNGLTAGADFLKQAYSGFDSEMISEIQNGYSLNIGAERFVDTLVNLSEYTYANREEIYNYISYYNNLLFDSIPCPDEATRQIIESLRASHTVDKDDFMEFAEVFRNETGYDSDFFDDRAETADLANGSYLSYSISKDGSAYKTVQRALNSAKYSYKKYCTQQLYHEKIQTPESVAPSLPSNAIGSQDYKNNYTETKGRINPCIAVEMYANTSVYQNNYYTVLSDENGNPLLYGSIYDVNNILIYKNGDTERSNIFWTTDNNDRICFSLRDIAEMFGEQIEWNESTETASIRRGDELIPMEGYYSSYIQGYRTYCYDKYWIPIREFEKLGYKIEYIETIKSYGKHIKINIIKP